ncbi:unnamed protein product [Ceutorhynchus assimilis]|uniref:KAT8 regulatory NSL complex subunit 3 n=1 Tax=Ceutorhynchus assimilis TaxID=467358 RepID=A0A9N9QN09_9CUCU|nr:unnamed protein product [Ceutorhynchus assimilis]
MSLLPKVYQRNFSFQQTPPAPPNSPNYFQLETLPTKNMVVEREMERSKYTYPMKMTNPYERDNWTVSTDHCYARPWDWRPQSSFLKPSKVLFASKTISKPLFSTSGSPSRADEIDVVTCETSSGPIYDVEKALSLMKECEKRATLAKPRVDENWEGRVNKINWTKEKHKLFNGFVDILNSFCLGKLAYSGRKNEPVLRRTLIDKAVQRVRRLFASIFYDVKLIQWLHLLFLDCLDQPSMALYLDILQTLRSKIPRIFDKMLGIPSSAIHNMHLTTENLLPLLKKRWDPVEACLMQDKPKTLPSNPVLVLMPNSPFMTKRNQKWMNLLSHLGTVVPIVINFGSTNLRITITNYLDQMFSITRGRIQDVRDNHPGRHIILVGIGVGATLALQMAQVETVYCVISLGFSMLTAEGKRGEPDDSLLELQCPVLFVIGQSSSTAFHEDMEDLRERMRITTGLIVVGSADNNLIVSKKKRKQEGITQSIVDRCIIDEIGDFIGGLILSPYPPQKRVSPNNTPDFSSKRVKMERKRYNSNTSSLDSEPPSPTPRITRPVGRPLGKTKCKLDSKWTAQPTIGTSSSTTSNPVPRLVALPSSTATTNTKLVTTPNNSSNSSSETISATESPVSPNNLPQKVEEVRKIRTILPEKSQKIVFGEPGNKEPARMQAQSLGMPSGQLLNLLQQGGIKISPVQKPVTPSSSTVKILQNVQLAKPGSSKLILNPAAGRTARPFDISQLKLRRPLSGSNMVCLADGKVKAITPSRPITSSQPNPPSQPSTPTRPITLNRPLPASRPIKQMIAAPGGQFLLSAALKEQLKRTNLVATRRLQTANATSTKGQPMVPLRQPIKTNLPAPTNLSHQDIMDLPIIFAEDNEILDSSNVSADSSDSTKTVPTVTPTTVTQPKPLPKLVPSSNNKYLLINRPTTKGMTNYVITSTATNTSTSLKRPLLTSSTQQPPKYTQIVLTKKSLEPLPGNIPSTSSLKPPIHTMELEDCENEIVATMMMKPNSQEKTVTMISKKGMDPSAYGNVDKDNEDPDYIPPKNLKL